MSCPYAAIVGASHASPIVRVGFENHRDTLPRDVVTGSDGVLFPVRSHVVSSRNIQPRHAQPALVVKIKMRETGGEICETLVFLRSRRQNQVETCLSQLISVCG